MPATIIGSTGIEFEPDIITENGRDGITRFQFSVTGTSVDTSFQVGSFVSGVPNQPPGTFIVVNRSVEVIASPYKRIKVSAEGGVANTLFISETGYQYNESVEDGLIIRPTVQIKIQYKLVWLAPTVTVTTNSQSQSDGPARGIAQQIISSSPVEIIQNIPRNVVGKKIDSNSLRVTGSSIEQAGGLYRVRATITKGLLPV